MTGAVVAASAVPLIAGLITAGANNASVRCGYTRTNPATTSGTLTTFQTQITSGSATSIEFFCVDPATLTVRNLTSTGSTTVIGLATYTSSLDVVAGDYLGVRFASAGRAVAYDTSGGGGWAFTSISSLAPGSDVSAWALVSGSGNLCLAATA